MLQALFQVLLVPDLTITGNITIKAFCTDHSFETKNLIGQIKAYRLVIKNEVVLNGLYRLWAHSYIPSLIYTLTK